MSKGNRLQDVAVGRADRYRFRHDQISPMPGLNLRDWESPRNQEGLAELKESIAQYGVIEPLTVTMDGGSVFITNGERRWRAVRELIAEGRVDPESFFFFCIAEPPGRNNIQRGVDLVLRNNGLQFDDLEMSRWVVRQHGYGQTQAEIAKSQNKTQAWVSAMFTLASASLSVQHLVRDGKVSTTTVIAAIREHGEDGAEALLTDAVKSAEAEKTAHVEKLRQELTEALEREQSAPPAPATGQTGNRRGRKPMSEAEKAKKALDKAEADKAKVTARDVGLSGQSSAPATVPAEPPPASDALDVLGDAVTDESGKPYNNEGNTPPKPSSSSATPDLPITQESFDELLTFAQYIATYCPDEESRKEANKSLVKCGYEPCEYDTEG